MKRNPAYAETDPGLMTEAEVTPGFVEQRKAMFEFLRHLMTLDSAALILVATLIEKVFPQPTGRIHVGISILAFLFSLLGGGFTYLLLVAHYPRESSLRMTSSDRAWYLWTMMLAMVGFITGISELAWFFASNWFHW